MSFAFDLQFAKKTLTNSDYVLVPVTDDGLVLLMYPNDTDHTISIPTNWGTRSIFHVLNSGSNDMLISVTGSPPAFPGGATVITLVSGGYANFTCIRDGTDDNDSYIFSTNTKIPSDSQTIKKFLRADMYVDATKFADNTDSPTATDITVELPAADSTFGATGSIETVPTPGTTLTSSNSTVFMNGAGGAVAIILPLAATMSAKEMTLIGTSVVGALTIDPTAPDTLYKASGATGTVTLAAIGDSVTLVSDGISGWWSK
jgi:hypothetical protein